MRRTSISSSGAGSCPLRCLASTTRSCFSSGCTSATAEAARAGIASSTPRACDCRERRALAPSTSTLRSRCSSGSPVRRPPQPATSITSRSSTISSWATASICEWAPRLALQYDYASGDRSPNDGRNERFDTLFGARRFDFGPTSLYGAFARSNINSPGVRLSLSPLKNVTAFVAYRAFWLASDRDAWTTAGLRDPSGRTRPYVGSQIEARVRWDVLPRNLRLEVGFAHLFRGEFIRRAPGASGQGAPTYVYSQAVIGF